MRDEPAVLEASGHPPHHARLRGGQARRETRRHRERWGALPPGFGDGRISPPYRAPRRHDREEPRWLVPARGHRCLDGDDSCSARQRLASLGFLIDALMRNRPEAIVFLLRLVAVVIESSCQRLLTAPRRGGKEHEMTITIQSEGRRHYLVGNTFPIKDSIRSAGCKWDGVRKAWWTGKLETAEQLLASLKASPAEGSSETKKDAPGEEAIVAGRAKYKGKTYYLAGREVRGRTVYDTTVDAVTSRDGSKRLLISRDGSLQFWASSSEVTVE